MTVKKQIRIFIKQRYVQNIWKIQHMKILIMLNSGNDLMWRPCHSNFPFNDVTTQHFEYVYASELCEIRDIDVKLI